MSKGVAEAHDKYTLVVTCVVIKKEPGNPGRDKVLILKRSEEEKEGPGLWTIPGGKVRADDRDDSLLIPGISHKTWLGVPERAMLREIYEETGIKVDFVSLSPTREKIYVRKDGTFTFLLNFWAVCSPETIVKIGKESTDYRWVTEEELDTYEFIGNVKSDILAVLGKK